MRSRQVLMTLILTILTAPCAIAQIKAQPQPAVKLPPDYKVNPEVLERATACPDPAALELDGNLVARSSSWPEFQGTIDIVGVVRNIGRGNYASGSGQQLAELIEESPGESPRVVRSARFTNLNAGGEVTLRHQRSWDVSREFPPRYILRITYDPDIRIDGNPANDDCRLGNNRTVIEPRRINVLFE